MTDGALRQSVLIGAGKASGQRVYGRHYSAVDVRVFFSSFRSRGRRAWRSAQMGRFRLEKPHRTAWPRQPRDNLPITNKTISGAWGTPRGERAPSDFFQISITALIVPSRSGSLVTWAYFPQTTLPEVVTRPSSLTLTSMIVPRVMTPS